MSITALAAHALSDAIHAREVSCRDVMRAYLERIAAFNPRFNAIVSLQDEAALLRAADACDAELVPGKASAGSRGWMHGLPQAIKDMSATAGIRTTLGSPLLADYVPQEDGLMAQRMKAAGCIVIGKTNTPEFGLGSHTFNEVFGITRNAYDPSKSAGGSSGGAAVSLALRMLPVADGSDFMGSLRNPAGWNNVFGFRPSRGRVPLWPAADVWVSQLGTEGPMGRTVRDVALLLETQAGYDARQPLSIAVPHGTARYAAELDAARPARIGWLGDLAGYLPMEPGVLSTCEGALRRFVEARHEVQPAQLGFDTDRLWQAWLVWRRLLTTARIAPLLTNAKNRASIKPEALWEYDEAQKLTGPDLIAASVTRTAYYQQLLALFERYDFLALPSAQVWPFDATMRWPQRIGERAMDTYHRWMEVTIYATFAGLPCINVPAGFGDAGLPMGLQLIGRPQADLQVLQLARSYERVAGDVLARVPPV